MKIPARPPSLSRAEIRGFSSGRLFEIIEKVPGPSVDGRYLHWDRLKYYPPPEGVSSLEWWAGLKFKRSSQRVELPLKDKRQQPFSYILVDPLPRQLHQFDFDAGGTISLPEPVVNPETRRQYYIRSLIEEAFTSSQIEGAATTRRIAKEIIRKRRPPRTPGERMVLNNYRTMEHILELREEPLSKEIVCTIQKIVTDGTLEDTTASGRFRRDDEWIVVGASMDEEGVYHTPPPADELDARMQAMCDFANGVATEPFIHPVIRAIILHFWLAYDHPFVDGNGRTGRALFYWSMLRSKYWLFEFISISTIILDAPAKYGRAFLETETDDNDLTYFLIYHAKVIERAIASAKAYIQRKMAEVQAATIELRGMTVLNTRQKHLLTEAIRHPGAEMTIESHRVMEGVTTQTARTDLLDLVERGLLTQIKVGRALRFYPVPDIEERLRRPPA